ncbi:hypothetical protein CKO40_12395 [Halochromatium glycolicum]|uniref:Uncharacterized protein n=1 Tax=Halochromatium glycolicum TaxID=85075 RepID=A0AAJ0U4V0_9GAMM|nr:hypothetical protein [Halochromatium glycolicum]
MSIAQQLEFGRECIASEMPKTLFLPAGSQRCRRPLAGEQAALTAAKIARKRAPTPRPLPAATIGLGVSAVLHEPCG